jgi:hypothetical protein
VIPAWSKDELIKQGKVAPGRTDVASTGIGIAVRKGAPLYSRLVQPGVHEGEQVDQRLDRHLRTLSLPCDDPSAR